MTDKERIEKLLKTLLMLSKKCIIRKEKGMKIIKIFVNRNQELSSPNTVSNIVIVKLASASKS